MKRKKIILHICIALVLISAILFLPVKVPYIVYGTGKVFTVNEWSLGKTEDGRITSTLKNNQLGTISAFGGREFQKGDVFDFFLDQSIVKKRYVKKGEKLGELRSNELQRLLVQLEGELSIERASLEVFKTGEKIQTVNEAQKNLIYAKEQFNTQAKLISRKEKLFRDSLIPPQEYDVAMNDYMMAKIGVELAEARLNTITTGEKPEQIEFIKQKIRSLENQIGNLNDRLSSLTVVAPFDGVLLNKKGGSLLTTVEPLVNISDTSDYIIVTPIQLKEIQYLKIGQNVKIRLFNSTCTMKGHIVHVDNAIQVVSGKQAVYVTAKISRKCPELMPGIIAQANITTDRLSLWEYGSRMITGTFYR
jgi:multidrug efflux pump subunit AcrA (membrane-fusion protein)